VASIVKERLMKNEHCIIVGGGICGLFSSILLADKFKNVTLIEKDVENGGLLKSVKDDHGEIYDQGTHVPNTTLVPEIDNILFGDETTRDEFWHDLGKLKTGNYFAGQWNLSHQMIDVRNLPKATYQKGIVELLSRTEESNAQDIVSYLTETLGPTFTHEVVAPIAKKLYGNNTDLSQLVKNSSVSYFGLARVLALTPEVTNKLKELSAFDSKLTYHNESDFKKRIEQDGTPQHCNYYPKNNQGVGFWIDFLINQAKNKGVSFINGDYVKRIDYGNKIITGVELAESGKKLNCDFLFWTVPPVLALKAASIPVESRAITFKSACIFHFTLDKPLLNNNAYYLWNWDKNFKVFRITLYANMQSAPSQDRFKVTAEILCDVNEVEDTSLADIYQELLTMGLIANDTQILSQLKQTIHHTFPVPTFEFIEAVSSNYQALSTAFDNIHIAGRFAGKSWFHQDVLKDSFYDISELFPY